jgi:hypothetical protein
MWFIIPLQAHSAAIIGRVDLADAVGLQLGNLIRQENPAATTKKLNVPGAAFLPADRTCI